MTVSPLPYYQPQPTPKVDPATLQPCPAWCSHHYDSPTGERSHSGHPVLFIGSDADSGKRVDIGVWLELRDHGAGVAECVGILDVKGSAEVEMPVGAVYRLSQALEGLVWASPPTPGPGGR
jgi:hypothetical protein